MSFQTAIPGLGWALKWDAEDGEEPIVAPCIAFIIEKNEEGVVYVAAIDENGEPWLLEGNKTPSVAPDKP